ncbi:MAG: methyl-accepting chemotaxis protein [Acidaminococcales bacterium]|nr:methyl-accepting chemotaxis protein [Acidaminococcales bacterium]
MSFTNFKTRTKILFLIFISVIVAILLGAMGGYFLDYNVKESEYKTVNFVRPVMYINQVRSNLWKRYALLLDAALETDANRIRALATNTEQAAKENDDIIADYLKTVSSGAAEDAARAKMQKSLAEFRQSNSRARELARNARDPAGLAIFNDYKDGSYMKEFEKLDASLSELIDILTKASRAMDAAQASEVSLILKVMAAIIVGASFLVLLFGLYISKNITTVLNEVTSVALSISDNDLTVRIKPETSARGDEFGAMGRALSKMSENLVATVKSIGSIAENIAASSEELHANADQTANASGEVANASTTMLESTEKASRSLDQAKSLVENSVKSLRNIAETTGSIASTADETSKTSRTGNESVETAVKSINSLGEGTAKVTEAVTELKDSSNKISEIVEMITSIASQTNLLALNAAIEAARAGEHGRGFAVVAEEVRKLAEESGKAAQEIDELIAKNTQSIQRTVDLMNEQRNLVGQGVDKVNGAGQSFVQIASLINSLAKQIADVKLSVQTTVEEGERTELSTRDVRAAVDIILSEVSNVSAAAQEQAASTEEIASSSQVLAQMAEDLSVISSKFKY